MAPCLAVIVCLFITTMAKSVKTSLDDVSGSQSSDQFWSNLFSEAQFLCTPSRVCEDRRQYPPTQTSLGSTGPKSGLHGQTNVLQTNVRADHVRAEGSVCLLRHTGEPGILSGETRKRHHKLWAHKKSWLRVVRKILAFGQARYRGQWFRRHHLSEHDISRAQRLSRSHRQAGPEATDYTPSTHLSRHSRQTGHGSGQDSISFLSVNTGGLSASKLDELLLWCADNSVQLFAVQETRWRTSLQWHSSGWNLIHSGPNSEQQSYSGILFGFRGSCLLRYDEVIPGRLLRVQLTSPSQTLPLEVLIVYNHYVDLQAPSDGQDASLEARHLLFTALERTISSIPQRHALLVLGDFNMHLPVCHPVCSCPDPSGEVSQDAEHLSEVLCSYGLRVLNTGHGTRGTTFRTSLSSLRGTRPDLVIARASMIKCIDAVRTEWSAGFLVPSAFGWHGALRGRLRRNWTPWMSSRHPSLRPMQAPVYDHDLLRKAQQHTHPLHEQCIDHLAATIGDSDVNLEQLSKIVYDMGTAKFAVANSTRKKTPPWRTSEVQNACRRKWQSYSLVRALLPPCTLKDFFKCWQAISTSLRQSKECQRVSRAARRSWLRSLCMDAESLGQKHDHAFFSVIRKLAPKSTRAPLGIRCILKDASSLTEEMDLFEAHFQKLFNTPDVDAVLSETTWDWDQTPSCDDLQGVFDRIPIVKAVPPSQPLGGVWRIALASPEVRRCLSKIISELPTTGIPTQFSNGLLTLLPKPSRSGKEVNHYRPLVIQCCIGKAILRWVAQRVLLTARPYLYCHPQFAYLSGRDAEMAIWRVQSFILDRRAKAGYSITPVSWAMAGWVSADCSGALIVSLDLTNAFDRVDRTKMIDALFRVGVSPDIIGIIRAWYLHPDYILKVGELWRKVSTTRGVRQGCTLAPLLWVTYLYCIIADLCIAKPDTPWLDLLTEYADDLILCFPFRVGQSLFCCCVPFRVLVELWHRD